jgi:tetrapyrrole methylase family protein/MazG family protein
MAPRVTVVGLGPGGADLLTAGTLAELDVDRPRHLRTTRHPAAVAVRDAISFDDEYADAERIEDVYSAIVERLVDAATTHGDVLYAVPGSPVVAEHSVELLVDDPRVEVRLVPALSFADLAWARLGVDPIAEGVRIIDGARFATAAAGERGPLLVCQCDRRDVLSDIKLAVEEPPSGPVRILWHLGLDDEAVMSVAWEDLDRTVDPDHLTSVYVPRLEQPVAAEVQALEEVVRRLRAECPWDREQTHETLERYLVEETYEVLDAIASGDPAHLEEELGDLLFQVVFHSTIATEEGWFGLTDVVSGIHDKLVARHPHVFGDVEVADAAEVASNWERLKAAEKGRASVLDGVPPALPALMLAAKVLRKATVAGVQVDGAAMSAADDLGGRLLQICVEANEAGIDPEAALRHRVGELMEEIRSTESH